MQSIVTFKGKEDGLEIYLDEKSTYPVLREELMDKLKKNQSFFKDSGTKVVIRGKELSNAQFNEIKRVFAMDFGIRNVYCGDEAERVQEAEISIEKPSAVRRAHAPVDEYTDEVELVSNAYFDAQERSAYRVRGGYRRGRGRKSGRGGDRRRQHRCFWKAAGSGARRMRGKDRRMRGCAQYVSKADADFRTRRYVPK